MLCSIHSIGILGLQTYPVTIETDISRGMPSFDIVGLPDTAVKESRDRVRAALKNCGYEIPIQKVTINLAPADIKKAGPIYDLPIFISLLQATKQLNCTLDSSVFLGELSLGGDVRRINGVLPMVLEAKKRGFSRVFVPEENALEGGIVNGIDVYGISNIHQLIGCLTGSVSLSPVHTKFAPKQCNCLPDFSEVKGQFLAKRALEIAAAGNHNTLLIGPPGSGKSMLAQRVPSILPELTLEEAIETTNIHSVAGILPPGQPLTINRPFRSPHYTISSAGLIGGGVVPRPGEISLAHNGVIFLDEFVEMNRNTKESLRAPMEDRQITITRSNHSLSYPCNTMVIAAMNPCPCGYYGHPTKPCTCTPSKVANYLAKVSGPILDRMDLHVEVPPVDFDELSDNSPSEPSSEIRKRVCHAREIQNQRFKGKPYSTNALMDTADLQQFCTLTPTASRQLRQAFDSLHLSARAYSRILKVARTIADLDGKEQIDQDQIMEAVQYRTLDRKYRFISF